MKERQKIATALGYYARATDPEAAVLARAIELHALTEYRHDVDCQIAFRKGWQKAEEHLEARGPERDELRALAKIIKDLIIEVQTARAEASLDAATSLNWRAYAPRGHPRDLLDAGVLTTNEAAEILARAPGDPTLIPPPSWATRAPIALDKPHYMKRADNGQLHCQDGKPLVYPTMADCLEACEALYHRMGIRCEPLESPSGLAEVNKLKMSRVEASIEALNNLGRRGGGGGGGGRGGGSGGGSGGGGGKLAAVDYYDGSYHIIGGGDGYGGGNGGGGGGSMKPDDPPASHWPNPPIAKIDEDGFTSSSV
jgi:uncharacterized membrane protein YgcG